MGVWLTDQERLVLAALCGVLIPEGEDGTDPGGAEEGQPPPGAVGAGAVDYIDTLLGAFSFDPPRIWAGGPTSGRAGGEACFERFVPLGRLDELAWRTRIEGSRGIAEREFNGPVVGYQERYRAGLAELGPDFCVLDAEAQHQRAEHHREFVELVFEHVCEAMYGVPEYGGNKDLVGWRSIGWAGDVQPRGWSDEEVAGP